MPGINHLQTNDNIRIVVAGSGALAIDLVNGILKSPSVATIVGILPASKVSGYDFLLQHPAEISLLNLAAEHELNLLKSKGVNSPSFKDEIRGLSADLLLVGNWSEIIKPPVLKIEGLCIINCHGSLLPKYRGASPYLATIFNGDQVTGITFHLVDQGVDTGDILFQEEMEVGNDETTMELTRRVAAKFGASIIPLIEDLKQAKIVPQKQTGVTSYVPALRPEWGWINWEADPCIIDQRFRALEGILPLATSIDDVVIGFRTGKVVKSTAADFGDQPFNENLSRKSCPPGMVVAVGPEEIWVSTRVPEFVVALEKPVFVPNEQVIPNIEPGIQFYSIECKGILDSE